MSRAGAEPAGAFSGFAKSDNGVVAVTVEDRRGKGEKLAAVDWPGGNGEAAGGAAAAWFGDRWLVFVP